MGIADQIISSTRPERKLKGWEGYYGIDERGLPIPLSPNDAYVIARIMCLNRLCMVGNVVVDMETRLPVKKTSEALFALCEKPEIVMPAHSRPEVEEQNYEMWQKVKRVINTERSAIWGRLITMLPQFDRRYIQVMTGLLWDRDKYELVPTMEARKEKKHR